MHLEMVDMVVQVLVTRRLEPCDSFVDCTGMQHVVDCCHWGIASCELVVVPNESRVVAMELELFLHPAPMASLLVTTIGQGPILYAHIPEERMLFGSRIFHFPE